MGPALFGELHIPVGVRRRTRSISNNGETIPVYWDQAYLTDYDSFVHSFIEAGIGMGGETLPETNASATGIAAWQSDGYIDSLWLSTVETIVSFFEGSFHKTAIFPLVDMTFFTAAPPSTTHCCRGSKRYPTGGYSTTD